MLLLLALLGGVWLLGSAGLVGLCRAAAAGDAVLARLCDRCVAADAHEYALGA